jgi:hypothetical protein
MADDQCLAVDLLKTKVETGIDFLPIQVFEHDSLTG